MKKCKCIFKIKNKILILLTSLFNENVNENTLYAIYDSLFLCGNITMYDYAQYLPENRIRRHGIPRLAEAAG